MKQVPIDMENHQTVYFSLTDHVFGTSHNNSIILLDVSKDEYISLKDSGADNLNTILSSSFVIKGHLYHLLDEGLNIKNEELNDWIDEFLEKNYIIKTHSPKRKSLEPPAIQPGGLSNYRWDTKFSWKPFKRVFKWNILQALIQLSRVHRIINKKGLKGLLKAIEVKSRSGQNHPSEKEISYLADCVDSASLLYPKKSYCLAWSATFVLLALKRGWKCHLTIGIQTSPFYAHAWVENSDKKVIHDDPLVSKVLSVILRTPF